MIAEGRISLDKLGPVRLVLAWMIVFYHTYRYLGVPHAALSWIAFLGPLATDLFFVISGISIALLYTDKIHQGELSLKQFFIRRVSKLYPLLLLILPHVFFSWILLVQGDVLDTQNQVLSVWDKTLACIYPYLLLDAWHLGYTPGIAPTWVISAFAFCYLFFFYWVRYMYGFVRKYVWLWLIGISALCVWLSQKGLSHLNSDYWGQIIHTFPPIRFLLFLIGAIWVWALHSIDAVSWKKYILNWPGWIGKFLLAGISLLILIAIKRYIWPVLVEPTTVWRLFFVPFTSILVVLWASSSWHIKGTLLVKSFRRWTNYSLPLFILHIPISVWYFRMWQAWRLNDTMEDGGIKPLLSEMKKAGYFERYDAWKYLLFILVCWLISSLAYRWMVEPFSNWVRKKLG